MQEVELLEKEMELSDQLAGIKCFSTRTGSSILWLEFKMRSIEITNQGSDIRGSRFMKTGNKIIIQPIRDQ